MNSVAGAKDMGHVAGAEQAERSVAGRSGVEVPYLESSATRDYCIGAEERPEERMRCVYSILLL